MSMPIHVPPNSFPQGHVISGVPGGADVIRAKARTHRPRSPGAAEKRCTDPSASRSAAPSRSSKRLGHQSAGRPAWVRFAQARARRAIRSRTEDAARRTARSPASPGRRVGPHTRAVTLDPHPASARGPPLSVPHSAALRLNLDDLRVHPAPALRRAIEDSRRGRRDRM